MCSLYLPSTGDINVTVRFCPAIIASSYRGVIRTGPSYCSQGDHKGQHDDGDLFAVTHLNPNHEPETIDCKIQYKNPK